VIYAGQSRRALQGRAFPTRRAVDDQPGVTRETQPPPSPKRSLPASRRTDTGARQSARRGLRRPSRSAVSNASRSARTPCGLSARRRPNAPGSAPSPITRWFHVSWQDVDALRASGGPHPCLPSGPSGRRGARFSRHWRAGRCSGGRCVRSTCPRPLPCVLTSLVARGPAPSVTLG